jgi:tRNA A-37 threonylcarbamoyl transferase component Bud32/tetratricopeptide (TPR) repeat protein
MFARPPGGTAVADRIEPSQSPEPTDAPPEILAGRYAIQREIGRGATATVYLARDTKYDRLVAVKALSRELAYALGPKRFLREIEITARLQHPNILSIHDSGEADGLLYYVTPYLEGESLRARLTKERQLPVDVVVRITTELADALQYAHERGIVHRDIKPENILFSGDHACVGDFGIAQAIQRAGGDRLTTTGLVLGTPAYMSPEQAAGDRDLDGRSDLYSLACVVYEMLAGVAPFIGPTPESVVAQRFSHAPRPVRAFRGSVPVHIERALTRAFALAPADRFADTKTFAEALATPGVEEPSVELSATAIRPGWTWQWALAGAATVIALGTAAMKLTGFGFGGGATLEPSRVAVLPFSGGGGRQLTDEIVRRDLYDAFRRWRDLDLVDLGTVGQVTSRPMGDKAAATVGRQLGAGQLVQAVVAPVGDSVRIDVALFDVTAGRRTRAYSLVVPDARAVPGDVYRRVATSLLREGELAAGVDIGDAGTTSIAAWRAYQRGLAAQQRWQLVQAESAFAKAASLDPSYAQAQLWLAQVGSWLRDNRPETWQEPASRAVAGSPSLTEHDRLMAQGVFALSRKQFSAACGSYDRLLAMDSLDVVAWFGRGECLAKDPTVVRDARSPSGWRFLTSRHAGFRAFLRGLELDPSAHASLSAARRSRLFYTAPNRVRVGYATPRDRFAAAPFFDATGDSIGFVPYPFAALSRGDPRTLPTTLDVAVRKQRELVLSLAQLWARREPSSPAANEALGRALEITGQLGGPSGSGESAVKAFRAARRLSTDRTERLRRAVDEVRVLIKQGDFMSARTLVDSVFLLATPSDLGNVDLAGLAALTNQPALTSRLIQLAAVSGNGSPDQNASLLSAEVPDDVRRAVADLVAHAALGACDSIPAQIARVDRAIEAYVEPKGRQRVWNTMVPRALSLAAPCDGGKELLRVAAPEDRLMRMQQAFARHDSGRLRAMFDTLLRGRGADRPGDVAIDYTYQEAWLLLAMGDTGTAVARLDHALTALSTLGDDVIDYVPQAAALGRAFKLRADVASKKKEADVAKRMERVVATLWRPNR